MPKVSQHNARMFYLYKQTDFVRVFILATIFNVKTKNFGNQILWLISKKLFE